MMSWAWLDKLQPWKEEGRLCFLVRKHLLIKFRKQPLESWQQSFRYMLQRKAWWKTKELPSLEAYHRAGNLSFFRNLQFGSDFFYPCTEPSHYDICIPLLSPVCTRLSCSLQYLCPRHRFPSNICPVKPLCSLRTGSNLSTDHCCPKWPCPSLSSAAACAAYLAIKMYWAPTMC